MKYTAPQLEFIEAGYKRMRLPELTVVFNRQFSMSQTVQSIKAATRNHKFLCGRRVGGAPGGVLSMTETQIAWLKKYYPKYSRVILTEQFNRVFGTTKKLSQIIAFVKNHNIKSGRTGKWCAESVSWNKGTKGLLNANATSFKKGRRPANIKPLGHERICTKDGYILIKITEKNPYTGAATRYKAKHVFLWESENGPTPDDHVITIIDANKMNIVIENLECISKQENVRRNKMRISSLPDALKPTAIAVAKLITRAHQMDRDNAQ
jgi:hypothetical protein